MIRGGFDAGREVNQRNVPLASAAYVLRLFAYFGGPLVLDAMVHRLPATNAPEHKQDVSGWLADALGQLVRANAAAAASTLEMNPKTMVQTIKLALARGQQSQKRARHHQAHRVKKP